MTYEEAIEIIKIAKVEAEWEYQMDYQIAFDMAIEAIEKQIPQKCEDIITSDNEYIGSRCKCGYFIGIPRKHCPNCGQAIDLSEVTK